MEVLAVISKVCPIEQTNLVNSAEPVANQRLVKVRKVYAGLGLAAGFLVALMLSVAVLLDHSRQNKVYFEQVFQSPVGQQQTVALPDGSSVILNTDSKIIAKLSRNKRLITLSRGEAYFEVAKNPSAPFVVEIDQASVTAVGTAFNIERSLAGYQLLVTVGAVDVVNQYAIPADQATKRSRSKSSVEPAQRPSQRIVAGQALVLEHTNLTVKKRLEENDIEANLAWREGKLLFRGESLREAFAEINRYSNTELVIEDSSIEAISVGGYFDVADTEQLIALLEYNFKLKSRKVGNRLLFSKSQ